MPVSVSYPGVYVEELPSGVRTITGVSTSVTAFLGKASRGPVDRPAILTSFADFERVFGGLDAALPLGYAVRDFFANGGSQAVVVRLYKKPGTGAARSSYAVTNLALEAASEGAWGQAVRVRVDQTASDPNTVAVAARLGVTAGDLFNLTVLDGATKRMETFLNLTTKESARRADRVLAAESTLVAVAASANLPQNSAPSAHAGSPTDADVWSDDTKSTPAKSTPSTTGVDSDTLAAADYKGSPADKTGMFALERTDLFNIMVVTADSRGGNVPTAFWSDALDYCVGRRAILVVDPESGWTTVDTARTGISGLALTGTRARNAAVYAPRVRQADPMLGGQVDTFAPGGTIAGVMARTDSQRGVWKAPAGTDATLNGSLGLASTFTDAENGLLNPLGINTLRTFPVFGNVVWGARTMRGADAAADEYKYLPVRRTALFIEESLRRGLTWVVFEPNDEPLWSQIRLNVGAFMHDLFRQGAFQGQTPKEAYLVKCDRETTTQNDVNRGVVNILVGFAPLKPAEFVIIQLQQLAGQIQT